MAAAPARPPPADLTAEIFQAAQPAPAAPDDTTAAEAAEAPTLADALPEPEAVELAPASAEAPPAKPPIEPEEALVPLAAAVMETPAAEVAAEAPPPPAAPPTLHPRRPGRSVPAVPPTLGDWFGDWAKAALAIEAPPPVVAAPPALNGAFGDMAFDGAVVAAPVAESVPAADEAVSQPRPTQPGGGDRRHCRTPGGGFDGQRRGYEHDSGVGAPLRPRRKPARPCGHGVPRRHDAGSIHAAGGAGTGDAGRAGGVSTLCCRNPRRSAARSRCVVYDQYVLLIAIEPNPVRLRRQNRPCDSIYGWL